MNRNTLLCFVGVLILLALLLVPGESRHGSGTFELTVRVSSKAGLDIKSVTCEAVPRLNFAQALVGDLKYWAPDGYGGSSATVEPFTGADIKMQVPFDQSIRQYHPWGQWHVTFDRQFQALLVVATLKNGQRIGVAVQIPQRQETRFMAVEIP